MSGEQHYDSFLPTNPGYEQLSYIARTQPRALKQLRQVVKRVHMKHYPAELLTDHEADRMIASFLPETIERLLKRAVDAGLN